MRDYLQKEIEMQLRTLMMDELPAIIHRLSLRLWCPEFAAREAAEMAKTQHTEEEVAIDPFSSPPQDAVDARGNVLDANEISSLSLDGGSETHSLFSQKNLLRLAALTDSHRTLSLFTPSIRDAVFRAWASPSERGESTGSSTPSMPSLIRSHSATASTSTTYTFTNKSSEDGALPTRPSLVSMQSAMTGLGLGAGRNSRGHATRKKKHRVVNLRKSKTTDDMSESGDSETASMIAASEPILPNRVPEEPEDNIITPPRSPSGRVRFRSSIDLGDSPRKARLPIFGRSGSALTSRDLPEQVILDSVSTTEREQPIATAPILKREQRPALNRSISAYPTEKPNSAACNYTPYLPTPTESQTPSILEQAWILKMASEIARRAHDEKTARHNFWSGQSTDEREDSPPPAYEPKAV